MPNIVEFAYFNLKEGVSVPDFLLVSDEFNDGFLSAQKGYVSRKLLLDGKAWADLVFWDTMEDVNHAIRIAPDDIFASKYLAFLDGKDMYCHNFHIKRSYQHQLIVPTVVTLVSYKLKEEVSAHDFLLSSVKLDKEYSSCDSDFISMKQLVDGDLWADLIFWKSMNGPHKVAKTEFEGSNTAMNDYLSFISGSEAPFHHHFSVAKSYPLDGQPTL